MNERPLTAWERQVIEVLAAVDTPWAAGVQESIPYLVWTSGCPCGCNTFGARDKRRPRRLRIPSYFSVGFTESEPLAGYWLHACRRQSQSVSIARQPEPDRPHWPEAVDAKMRHGRSRCEGRSP